MEFVPLYFKGMIAVWIIGFLTSLYTPEVALLIVAIYGIIGVSIMCLIIKDRNSK